MERNVATTAARRPWQEVARERGISLRELGELIGRRHTTMIAYSGGFRVPPQEVMGKIAQALGEDVR